MGDSGDGFPYIGQRKLISIGGSVYICIPTEFLKENDLKVGDEVTIVARREMLISKSNNKKLLKAHEKIEQMTKEDD